MQDQGREFVSLNKAIGSGSARAKQVVHIAGALAEFERALILERTRAGMAAARMRERYLSRSRARTGAQLRKARDEIAADREASSRMATLLGVSRSPCGER